MNYIANITKLSLLKIAFKFTSKAPRPANVSTAPTNIQPLTFNNLSDNPGSRRFKKRVGRGPGSGLGKFAGRGMKGQKAKPGGGPHPRFEGGQTPLQKRIPKYGMKRSKYRLD